MQVRPANRKDLPQILEIYNEAVLNTTASYDYEPRTLEHRTAWYEERVKANFPIFVAEDGKGQVVGWSALNPFHSRIGYQYTAENSVYVAAEQRGKGIGKLLMPPLIDGAKARGLHAIIAAIDAQNEASIRLHAQFVGIHDAPRQQQGIEIVRPGLVEGHIDRKFITPVC